MSMKNVDSILVEKAINYLGTEVLRLGGDEVRIIWKTLVKQYSAIAKYEYPFWEYMEPFASVCIEHPWKRIDHFVKDKNLILLLEWDEEQETAWEFNNVKDLQAVLNESIRYDFYLTDRTASYLIAYNDHGYLIASGAAMSVTVTGSDN